MLIQVYRHQVHVRLSHGPITFASRRIVYAALFCLLCTLHSLDNECSPFIQTGKVQRRREHESLET